MTVDLIIELTVSDDGIDTQGDWGIEDWLREPSKLKTNTELVDFLADFLTIVKDVAVDNDACEDGDCEDGE